MVTHLRADRSDRSPLPNSGSFVIVGTVNTESLNTPLLVDCLNLNAWRAATKRSFQGIRYYTEGSIMLDEDRTREQLLQEIATLRQELSESKKVEEGSRSALLNSREHYRSLLELSPDGILTADLKGNITSCNSSFEELTGFPRDEIVGKHFSRLPTLYKRDLVKFTAVLKDVLLGRPLRNYEFRWKNNKGELRHGSANIDFLENQGRKTGILILLTEITERKRTARAIIESEGRLRELFETKNYGIAIYEVVDEGEDFIFRDINEAGQHLSNVRKEDVMGKRLSVLFPAAEEIGLMDALRNTWKDGIVRHIPLTQYSDQRISQWVENWIYRLPSGEVAAIYEDTTAVRQAEEALKESEARYRRVSDNSPAVLYQYQMTPDGDISFPYISHVVETIFGVTAEEVMRDPMKLIGMVHPDDIKMFQQKTQRSAESLESFPVELRCLKEGKVIWVEARGMPTPLKDGRTLWDGYLIDISDRKKAEEALHAEQERLSDIASTLPGAIYQFILDPDGSFRIPYMSPGAEILIGRPLKGLLHSAKILNFIHPDDRIAFNESVAVSAETLEPWELEFRIIVPGGGNKWLKGVSNPRALKTGGIIWNGILLDIDQLKRTEQALRENEEFLEMTGDIARVGGWHLNSEFNEVLWTRTTGRIHELPDGFVPSLEEAINYYHPEDRETVRECVRRAIEEGKSFEFDTRLVTGKGNQRWVRAIGKPTMKDGKCVWLSGTFQDITERKETELEKLQIEERFRTIFNKSFQFALILDVNGTILDMNELCHEACGSLAESSMGKPFWEADWWSEFPDVQQKTRIAIRKVQEGESATDEVNFRDKESNIHQGIRIFSPIRDENGTLNFISVTGLDVTDRTRALMALKESEENFRLLTVNSPDMMMVQSPDGIITYINPQAKDVIGYTPDEITSINVFDSIYPDDVEMVLEANRNALSGQEIINCEYRFSKPSGEIVWLDHTARPIMIDGKLTGIQSTIRDITPRKLMDQELKHYRDHLEELVTERTRELAQAQEKLLRQERLAALGKVAGSVSHELRNPMATMNNAAFFLRMVLEDPDPDVLKSIEIIENEIQGSTRIIETLLDFARSPPASPRQGVDVNEAIQSALLGQDVPENINVISNLDHELDDIMADPVHLQQAIHNIILNGIQAMPDGGTLTLTTSVSEDNGIVVRISDTGVGMSETVRDNLFEPLFSTKAKGIGLGLPLSKTLIEMNGGGIVVDSTEGEGSTFTIRLLGVLRPTDHSGPGESSITSGEADIDE